MRRKPVSKGAASPTHPLRLAAHARHMRAIELRIGGASFEQIARSLGYANKGAAYKAVHAGMTEQRREKSNLLRKIENARLDRLWLAMFPLAQRGDMRAASVCVRISKRRCELLGIDRPKNVNVQAKVAYKGPMIKMYRGIDVSQVAPSAN